jgi:hypothetical protein
MAGQLKQMQLAQDQAKRQETLDYMKFIREEAIPNNAKVTDNQKALDQVRPEGLNDPITNPSMPSHEIDAKGMFDSINAYLQTRGKPDIEKLPGLKKLAMNMMKARGDNLNRLAQMANVYGQYMLANSSEQILTDYKTGQLGPKLLRAFEASVQEGAAERGELRRDAISAGGEERRAAIENRDAPKRAAATAEATKPAQKELIDYRAEAQKDVARERARIARRSDEIERARLSSIAAVPVREALESEETGEVFHHIIGLRPPVTADDYSAAARRFFATGDFDAAKVAMDQAAKLREEQGRIAAATGLSAESINKDLSRGLLFIPSSHKGKLAEGQRRAVNEYNNLQKQINQEENRYNELAVSPEAGSDSVRLHLSRIQSNLNNLRNRRDSITTPAFAVSTTPGITAQNSLSKGISYASPAAADIRAYRTPDGEVFAVNERDPDDVEKARRLKAYPVNYSPRDFNQLTKSQQAEINKAIANNKLAITRMKDTIFLFRKAAEGTGTPMSNLQRQGLGWLSRFVGVFNREYGKKLSLGALNLTPGEQARLNQNIDALIGQALPIILNEEQRYTDVERSLVTAATQLKTSFTNIDGILGSLGALVEYQFVSLVTNQYLGRNRIDSFRMVDSQGEILPQEEYLKGAIEYDNLLQKVGFRGPQFDTLRNQMVQNMRDHQQLLFKGGIEDRDGRMMRERERGGLE